MNMKDHPLYLFGDFRKLFAGRVVSAIGDKFFNIAIAWWVLSRDSTDAKLHLGLLMAVSMLPVVVLGPFSGTLVDRVNRKTCMLIADFFRGFFVGILCYLLYREALSMAVLYILCFCITSFVPLFESSVNSSLEDLTDRQHIGGAVALNASVVQLSNIFGAFAGSVFMATLGTKGAFFLNAVSFMISFIFIMFITKPLLPEKIARENYFDQFRNGFSYIKNNKPIMSLMIVFGLLNFFAMPIMLLMPMIVKFIIKETVTWVAIFEAFMALGSGITSIVLSFKRKYSHVYQSIFMGLILMGIMHLALAFTVNKFLICFLIFLGGCSLSSVNAIALTLFQYEVVPEMKGRFFSILTTICYGVTPLAYMLCGYLSDAISINFILLMNGTAIVILSLSVLLIPKRINRLGYDK